MRRLLAIALVAVAAACGGDTPSTSLEIESTVGYAVIVEQIGEQIEIGLNSDRDATAGEAYDVTHAIWRVEDGPWNEPPATCVGRGQRVELGVTMVENETRPGLLMERVVWLVCLAP
ncbi:MAG: hypothetical protein WD184_02035 [Acidimicrobiia bacterium]